METQVESNSGNDIAAIKKMRPQLDAQIEARHKEWEQLIASLQTLVPDLASSLNLSLQVISSFNGHPFTPLSPLSPSPNLNTNPYPSTSHLLKKPSESRLQPEPEPHPHSQPKPLKKLPRSEAERRRADDEGAGCTPLSLVRSMVVVCLLERIPFSPIDSSTVLRKLENDQTITAAEKTALREVGGESGAILVVEMALRSMAQDNRAIELEEFVVSGKSRVMNEMMRCLYHSLMKRRVWKRKRQKNRLRDETVVSSVPRALARMPPAGLTRVPCGSQPWHAVS
ncbi:hypothetical protein Cgig2_000852 [Carnegiea gigantea]|uniref:Uncharacterized protein n=1 Tax=Carnegiea gigantea TaxID=171969 RepID=A0A9Q1GNR0_9CARY|nr:hypothetical protein Cgig2_000852 [Carnegiea gigantea]